MDTRTAASKSGEPGDGRMEQPVEHAAEGRQSVRSRRKPRRGPRLRAASFEDHEQIDRLGSRYGLTPKSYELWSNLWLGNPVYREVQGRWSIGWVLEDEDDRIVGSMGNIPVSYEFQGRTLLAAAGHCWVAEPEYRSAALVLLDHLLNQPGVDLFVNTSLGPAATPGMTAFQCPRVPVGVWDESAFWITHYQGFLESFLTLKGYPLAKLLSYPLSAAVYAKERLTRKTRGAIDVKVEGCPRFDERFDDFWVELKRRNPHLLLAVRTREVLEWHYTSQLLSNRLWIATIGDGTRLVAYAVFDRRDRPSMGLKRLRLVDYQSLDGRPDLLLPLLSWALRRCRAEGIHALECFGRWLEKGEFLDTIVPYRRRLPNWRFFYRVSDPVMAESLGNPSAWAPTLYDGDASLV